MSNQTPCAKTTVNACQVCGQKVTQSQTSISALNAKPSTKHSAANGIRPRMTGASAAPAMPQAPQASICHGVHGPCPRKKFDASAATAPVVKPARAPSAAPAAMTT